MEKVDLDQVIKEFSNLDIPNNEIIQLIPNLLHEIELLRSENEAIKKTFKALFESRGNDYNNRIEALEDEIDKLEKVAEAADKNANRDLTYEEYALRQALKEWKGDK